MIGNIKIFIFILFLVNFMGCATAPLIMPPKPEGIPGIYHRVERSQTLWRISKIYAVDLEELARINRISDSAKIEVGQLIFIPRQKKQPTIPITSLGEEFIWPIKGRVITDFNQTFNSMVNKGINIQPYSDTDILASRSGRIVFYSPNLKGYGRAIIIDHPDGFSTVYTGNLEVLIKIGDNVQRGTVIARANPQGRDKPTFLHFEIRKRHVSQNPHFYLP